MTDKAISPLRRRLIEDMTIRRLSPKTHYQYIRHVKKFADFLGRSADKATAEDVHRYQLWLASAAKLPPECAIARINRPWGQRASPWQSHRSHDPARLRPLGMRALEPSQSLCFRSLYNTAKSWRGLPLVPRFGNAVKDSINYP